MKNRYAKLGLDNGIILKYGVKKVVDTYKQKLTNTDHTSIMMMNKSSI